MEYTYLLLNIVVIIIPLVFSFDKNLLFYKNWRYILPATAVVGAVFIIWDVIFTRMGVWSFNPKYLTGIEIINLPLEEWLFFITIPYACVFVYETLYFYMKRDILEKYASPITVILIIGLLVVAVLSISKLYTTVTFILLAFLLIFHLIVFRSNYLGHFYFSFLIILIPFFVINGVLTSLPVVIYNDMENLGIRLFSIPVEDVFYGMLLLLGNVTIYESLIKLRS